MITGAGLTTVFRGSPGGASVRALTVEGCFVTPYRCTRQTGQYMFFWESKQDRSRRDLERCLATHASRLDALGVTHEIITSGTEGQEWFHQLRLTWHGVQFVEFRVGWVRVPEHPWYLEYPLRAGQPRNPYGVQRPFYARYPGLALISAEFEATVLDALAGAIGDDRRA